MPNYSALCPFPSIRIVKKEEIPPTLPGQSDQRGARTRETAVPMVTGQEEDAETEQKRNGNRAICMVSPTNARPSTSLPARERRQTAIKIRFLFSGSVRGYYVLDPPSRFFDRFVEAEFEFRSGLRNPRVGTHAWARNAIVFRSDGHFKTNTCLSRDTQIAREKISLSPSLYP